MDNVIYLESIRQPQGLSNTFRGPLIFSHVSLQTAVARRSESESESRLSRGRQCAIRPHPSSIVGPRRAQSGAGGAWRGSRRSVTGWFPGGAAVSDTPPLPRRVGNEAEPTNTWSLSGQSVRRVSPNAITILIDCHPSRCTVQCPRVRVFQVLHKKQKKNVSEWQ